MPTTTKSAPEAILKGFREAFVAAGFIDAMGVSDNALLRDALFEPISRARVMSKGERFTKAINKWDLTAAVFPAQVPPDGNDDPVITAVWKELQSHVWNQCSTHAGVNNMQRMVGMAMDGFCLCRTKVKDAPAVYVTNDYACIVEDKRGPEESAVKRAIERDQIEVEMHMARDPENAKKYEGTFNANVRKQLNASAESLKLTLESVTITHTDDDSE